MKDEGGHLLDAAAGLSWLAPSASSLAALARPSRAWEGLRHDPAAVLLLLRHSGEDFPLHEPAALAFAAARLAELPAGLAGWDDTLRPVHDSARVLARLSSALARLTGRADPCRAWCCGLLAPLGWLAVGAISAERMLDCWTDPALARDPVRTQERHWGASAAGIARRLCRRWEMPAWITGVIGRLELPAAAAARLGGDASLLAIVRVATHLAAQAGVDPNLTSRGDPVAEDAALLGLDLGSLSAEALLASEPLDAPPWKSPYDEPLLRDLLAVAEENRRLRGGPPYFRLEGEADGLQAALRDQMRGEADRLREAKLSALAEFAAGAGHEINNPLAVISGEAQYILGHGEEWLSGDEEGTAKKSLNTIIAQTRRIHAILRDLMLFARPAPARPANLDLPTLLGEVASSFADLAASKNVRIEVRAPARLAGWADQEQLRQALGCLVRNAVEAAGTDGWARLGASLNGEEIDLWVEDSGPGPAAEQRPHLFDPFYSGRNAGRGKGLGLPVAWRLARQQGGDVRLEPARPGMPTRFVLTLPAAARPGGRGDVSSPKGAAA
jgi:signal transduction histidine kinase